MSWLVCLRRRLQQLTLVLICISAPFHHVFSDTLCHDIGPGNRVGVALSGGGARGFAHIGVFRAMEELQIPVCAIAGTSMGSFVGALYATGHSPDEIYAIMKNARWDVLFSDDISRSYRTHDEKNRENRFLFNFEAGFGKNSFGTAKGVLGTHNFDLFLFRLFQESESTPSFHDLMIPFTAVATNAETGYEVHLVEGHLSRAVLASMSVSGFLTPVEIDGQYLIDGMYANNLPVSVLNSMDVDIKIGVDVSTPLKKLTDLQSFFEVDDQSESILTQKNTREAKLIADIVIEPGLKGCRTDSMDKIDEAVHDGYESAMKILGPWKNLLAEPLYVEKLRRTRSSRRPKAPVVKNVIVKGDDEKQNRNLRSRLHTQPGKDLDFDEVAADHDRIFGTGRYQKVSILTRGDAFNPDLVFLVQPKTWGPNYLRFGLSIYAQARSNSEFTGMGYLDWNKLLGKYDRLEQTVRVGNELGIDQVYSIPFMSKRSSGLSLGTSIIYEDTDFQTTGVPNEENFLRSKGTFSLWQDFRDTVYFSGGYFIEKFAIIGQGPFLSGFKGLLDVDRLNQAFLPTKGFRLLAEGMFPNKPLGSDTTFMQGAALLEGYATKRKTTFFGRAMGANDFNTDVPQVSKLTVGGINNAFGRPREYFRVSDFEAGQVGLRQQIDALPSLFYRGLHVELVGELMHIDDTFKGSGKFGFYLDTKMAPISIVYGHSGYKRFQIYIVVGIDSLQRSLLYPN